MRNSKPPESAKTTRFPSRLVFALVLAVMGWALIAVGLAVGAAPWVAMVFTGGLLLTAAFMVEPDQPRREKKP